MLSMKQLHCLIHWHFVLYRVSHKTVSLLFFLISQLPMCPKKKMGPFSDSIIGEDSKNSITSVFSYYFSESSPPYCSPTRILTPLYFQSKQITLESLFEIYLRSITALCLDPGNPRTSLPDSLQGGDTNRVYFLAIRNFYKDLSVFLENLCCMFDSDLDLPFLPPGISTLVYYMVTQDLYPG